MGTNFEEDHKLDAVEDLFEYLDIDAPTDDQMITLYDVFKKDLVLNPITVNLVQVDYDKRASKHPLFKGKPIGFEHICTRESKHSGKRNFDPIRANKIHWIKPVILYKEDVRIKYFERLHFSGQNQQYYWFKDKGYVVIIREITVKLQLVTAFVIDDTEKRRFLKWYEEYKK